MTIYLLASAGVLGLLALGLRMNRDLTREIRFTEQYTKQNNQTLVSILAAQDAQAEAAAAEIRALRERIAHLERVVEGLDTACKDAGVWDKAIQARNPWCWADAPPTTLILSPSDLAAMGIRLHGDTPTQDEAPAPHFQEEECDHGVCFDAAAAAGLPSDEVRRRWPRHSGVCTKCGFVGAAYASYAHLIAGDW